MLARTACVPVQVLELESLGIKVRNTKRFFVLNPTSINYEFVWSPAPEAAPAGNEGHNRLSPFTCVTRRGIIGSGRCAGAANNQSLACGGQWSCTADDQRHC